MVSALQKTDILKRIPHCRPFRFIDEIEEINDEYVRGGYTFRPDEFFYLGHYPDNPITPEAILIETLVQIGVLPLGIFLLNDDGPYSNIAFTSSDIKFFHIVYPGDKVIVESQKVFFSHNIIKCEVKMYHQSGNLVCSGLLCGSVLTHWSHSRV
jgi:3-hydroxyacyl-[acyl-carrier-protein] dehydratase